MTALDWILVVAVIILVPAFWIAVGIAVGRWITRRK